MPVIEVFADVACPFAYVGLRRLSQAREEAGRSDLALRIRAWPLELVNDEPLDPDDVAEEVADLRRQVAPDLFTGFDPEQFPPTSLPALDLAASAYAADRVVGERVSMALRAALFEDGLDISRPDVLQTIASQEGAPPPSPGARDQVQADWRDGQARDVSGSPHWFVGEADFFCPSLEIERVGGHLQIHTDPAAFDAFLKTCLAL